jgi:hypothetical protein
MGAEHDRFRRERRIGARQDADDVRGAEIVAPDVDAVTGAVACSIARDSSATVRGASNASAPAVVSAPETMSTGAAVASSVGSASLTISSAAAPC